MRLLLFLLLAAQAIPPPIQKPSGVITGRIRLSNGLPAVGLRVSAMLAADATGQTNTADVGALFSQTQTDEVGRYRLEDVPPGRYYVMAGRIDAPTFHPGTTDQIKATAISVASGTPIEGIDFTVTEVSAAAPSPGAFMFRVATPANIGVRARVTAEAGSHLPLVSAGGRIRIRASSNPVVNNTIGGAGTIVASAASSGVTTVFTASGTFQFSGGGVVSVLTVAPTAESPIQSDGTATLMVSAASYRFSIDGLPANYEVKSMSAGPVDLLNSSLSITAPAPEINVIIGLKKTPPRLGRTVSGRVFDGIIRKEWIVESVSLSGIPGTVFSGGFFEFIGVTPGNYVLRAEEGPPGGRRAEANIAVGNADVTTNLTYTAVPLYANVAGKIVMDDGTSIPANVSARLQTVVSGYPTPAVVMPDGTFKMILPQGSYDFSLTGIPASLKVKSIAADSVDLLSQPLHVQPQKGPIGPDVLVTLTAVPRVKVRGRVVADPPTRSVDGAEVALTGGPEGYTTRAQADGTFEFLPVLPGKYTLTIRPFGFSNVTEAVIVEDKDLVLEFKSQPLY